MMMKGYIVVDVYLLTMTLFLLALVPISRISKFQRFQAEVLYISPWTFRNSSH